MPAIDYEMESIRNAVEEASRYLAENPEAAAATDAAATAVREEGLRFRVEGPKGSVSSDMTKAVGGSESAPSPAWLLRAALASCDATLVAMEAARAGIDLTGLEVTVESDSDFRGVLGVDDERQLLVIDLDRLGGVERLRLALGHHHGNRFPDMARLVGRQQHVRSGKHGAAARPRKLHVELRGGHRGVWDRLDPI